MNVQHGSEQSLTVVICAVVSSRASCGSAAPDTSRARVNAEGAGRYSCTCVSNLKTLGHVIFLMLKIDTE